MATSHAINGLLVKRRPTLNHPAAGCWTYFLPSCKSGWGDVGAWASKGAWKEMVKMLATAQPTTKEKIRAVTTDLLIKHGYRGTNFRLIAEKVGTTTTNIHYHFGGKESLIHDVVRGYVDQAIRRQSDIWRAQTLSLKQQLAAASDSNRKRYTRYNTSKNSNNPWNLIGRLRMETDVLPLNTAAVLNHYTASLRADIRSAVMRASALGELRREAPLENITTLLAGLVNSSAAVASDAGFEQLLSLYTATSDVIFSAYATTGDGNGFSEVCSRETAPVTQLEIGPLSRASRKPRK
jgi:TetR/AcrR family transcriptional regulator, transcriptional repressor for nem operon